MACINFPIFDQLLSLSSSYDKKLSSNSVLVKKINSLDHKDKESVYLIVKLYMIKFDKNSPLSMPYYGNIVSRDGDSSTIEFDLDKFPDELVKLLNIFIKIIKKK